MTTIATVANSWSISIGEGWIVLMLVGMGLCFVFMLGSMRLMGDGRGWAMCRRSWQRTPPPTDIAADTLGQQQPDRAWSPEGEARP